MFASFVSGLRTKLAQASVAEQQLRLTVNEVLRVRWCKSIRAHMTAQLSSSRRRMVKSAAEQDVFTDWRHLYAYLERPGVKSGVKRQARRRERREGKLDICRGTW
jgi:hypothetical protein